MNFSAEKLLFLPKKECKIKHRSSYYAEMLFHTVSIGVFLSTSQKSPIGHVNMIDFKQDLKNNTV